MTNYRPRQIPGPRRSAPRRSRSEREEAGSSAPASRTSSSSRTASRVALSCRGPRILDGRSLPQARTSEPTLLSVQRFPVAREESVSTAPSSAGAAAACPSVIITFRPSRSRSGPRGQGAGGAVHAVCADFGRGPRGWAREPICPANWAPPSAPPGRSRARAPHRAARALLLGGLEQKARAHRRSRLT